MTVLQAAGLGHAFSREAPVLADVDLDLVAGRRYAVVGANGSGKSTLLRCLSGALRPRTGRVVVNGAPLEYSRAGLRRHRRFVQLVTQDPDDQLFSASVAADVSFGPVNLGLPADQACQRVEEALRLLAVTHLRDRPTHEISFGERKRVAIAGAVAMRPGVLILDEPTAGLDPAAVGETMHALARLHRAGTTLLLSTHDLDLALAWADEVAVIVDGRICRGTPAGVLADTDLVRRARLRTPWVLTVLAELTRTGLVPATATARDEAELLGLLRQAPAGLEAGPAARDPERGG